MGFSSGSAYPSSAFGYWRGGGSDGSPLYLGQGSGMGLKQQGLGVFSAGQGSPGSGGAWEPTVVYLLLLVVGEVIVFGFIARMLR